MIHGVERFRVVDGNSASTACGFALIEACGDGGGKGMEASSSGVFGFETVLIGVSG